MCLEHPDLFIHCLHPRLFIYTITTICYLGILIALSITGPGLGFLVGGAFLEIYTYPNKE